MFSVIVDVPFATVINDVYCACKSVGKPGYGPVDIEHGLIESRPAIVIPFSFSKTVKPEF